MGRNAITTQHDLDFESAPNPYGGDVIQAFRIGTCTGQWGSCWDSYFILTVINDQPGNGHFDDVLEWFEYSAKRDNKNLIVLELWNDKLYLHLISKRGFIPLDTRGDHVIKVFNEDLHIQLKERGNEILIPGTLETK